MDYFFKKYSFIVAIVFSGFTFGQSKVKDFIIEGNESYKKGNFDKAEYAYKRAVIEDPTSVKANYNLGNALYHQKRYKESITHYNRSAEIAKTNQEKHLAYHNIGNAHLEEQDYSKAVESYKKALKNDPHDESTRYNLAYANKMLKKQQQQNQNSQNKKDSSNDQKKENQQENQKDKEQNQKNNQQQNQNQKNNQQDQSNQPDNSNREKAEGNPKSGGQNGDQKGKGNQPNQNIQNGSKGDNSEQNNEPTGLGEGMLKALKEQEARTQRRIIQEKADKQRTQTSKDW